MCKIPKQKESRRASYKLSIIILDYVQKIKTDSPLKVFTPSSTHSFPASCLSGTRGQLPCSASHSFLLTDNPTPVLLTTARKNPRSTDTDSSSFLSFSPSYVHLSISLGMIQIWCFSSFCPHLLPWSIPSTHSQDNYIKFQLYNYFHHELKENDIT